MVDDRDLQRAGFLVDPEGSAQTVGDLSQRGVALNGVEDPGKQVFLALVCISRH